jgi:hypothetical protein
MLDFAFKYTRLFNRNRADQMAFQRVHGLPLVSVYGGQGIPVQRVMMTEQSAIVVQGNTLTPVSILGAGNTPWTSPELTTLTDAKTLSQQLSAMNQTGG